MSQPNWNCMLCYPNFSDSGTLADPSGAWSSSAPLSNLQNPYLSKYARTNNLSTSLDPNGFPYTAAIDINFGSPQYLSAMALIKHNLSLNATCRTILWVDGTKTGILFDSGYQPVWPGWFDTINLMWGMSNFWGGKVPSSLMAVAPTLFPQLIKDSSGNQTLLGTQYATQYIYDALNPAGYLQVGRNYCSSGYQPLINMSWGATIQWVDPSLIDIALDGTELYEQRTMYRKASISLDWMSKNESVNNALWMTKARGITGDLLFIWDPTDGQNLQQMSFVGRFDQLSALSFPSYGITSMPFSIKELV